MSKPDTERSLLQAAWADFLGRQIVPIDPSWLGGLVPGAGDRALALVFMLVRSGRITGWACPDDLLDALVRPALEADLARGRVVDSAGQHRPVYGPFLLANLLRCGLMARRLGLARLEDPWMGPLRRQVEAVAGANVPETPVGLLWDALVLQLAAQLMDQGLAKVAADRWRAAVGRQHVSGRMHDLDADSSLDAFVYDELCALHAAVGYAKSVGDAALLGPVHALAAYHCANTQPDNTTNQPWGMGAFALFADTRPFALQQFHDVRSLLAHRTATAGMAGIPLALVGEALVLLEGG